MPGCPYPVGAGGFLCDPACWRRHLLALPRGLFHRWRLAICDESGQSRAAQTLAELLILQAPHTVWRFLTMREAHIHPLAGRCNYPYAGAETQERRHTWAEQGRMPLLAPFPACQGRYLPLIRRDRSREPGLAAQPLKGIPGIPGRKLRPRTATDAAPGNGADSGSCGLKQRRTHAPVSGR